MFGAPRRAAGVKLDWASAPGDYRVLVSADGASFKEAAGWQAPRQASESAAEFVMFGEAAPLLAVKVQMRKPRAWGCFGLRRVEAVVHGGTAMLVSSGSGVDRCVTADAVTDLVATMDCLEALAAGDGRETFFFDDDGVIRSGVDSDLCLGIPHGGVVSGGRVGLVSCAKAAAAGDGRALFELGSSGQLKLPRMGNVCVSSVPTAELRAVECDEAASVGSDGFVEWALCVSCAVLPRRAGPCRRPVTEVSFAAAAAARDASALATKAWVHLEGAGSGSSRVAPLHVTVCLRRHKAR